MEQETTGLLHVKVEEDEVRQQQILEYHQVKEEEDEVECTKKEDKYEEQLVLKQETDLTEESSEHSQDSEEAKCKKRRLNSHAGIHTGAAIEEDVLRPLEPPLIRATKREQRDQSGNSLQSIMRDEKMANYLLSRGDQKGTLSFNCQAESGTSTDQDALLRRLRQKIERRKMKSKTLKAKRTPKNIGNTSAEKTARRIEVGWLNFSNNAFHQVRTRKGGGTKHMTVDKSTTVAQILEIGKGLFFPNGVSKKGRVEDFMFTICDFKRNQIPMEDTIGNLYKQSNLRLLRFYICSKGESSEDESSSEVDELEDCLSEVFSEEVHPIIDSTSLVPRSSSDLNREEQIGKELLSIMRDEHMANYLPSCGDREAAHSFNRQTDSSTSTDQDTLLGRLKEKTERRKMKSKSKRSVTDALIAEKIPKNMGRLGNTSAQKATRRIEVGWFNFKNDAFHQVRTRSGGGTKHMIVDKKTTAAQILEIGKGLFFPKGISKIGRVKDFKFTICDFKNKQIPLEDTVGSMYKQTNQRLLRFYICSKGEFLVDESSSEVEELEDCVSEVHPLIDASVLVPRSSSDRNGEKQMVDFLELHPTSRKQSTPEAVATQHPERLHHPCSTPILSGHEGSTQLEPGLGFPGIDVTVEWDPDDSTSRLSADETIVITLMSDQEERAAQSSRLSGLPQKGLHFHPAEDLNSAHTQPIEEEMVPNLEDNGQLSGPWDLSPHSSSQLSTPEAADSLGPSETSQCVSVRRIKVVDDLLSVFMDNKIMNIKLKMALVNEKAVDHDGVSREIYTAFWDQFLEYCEGEDERVPILRPDFWDSEWQAVGRIWVKGLLDHGVLPVRLCKAFILACIHGIDCVDKDILMSSFLNYLPLVERSAVESALQGTIDDSNEEDLMDLFTRMGSHSLPSKGNFKASVETMAHKAILQEPKYVIDCFAIPMAQVKQKLSDKTSILFLYDSKQPTGKRVAQLLETTDVILSQREQTTFNHLQRYVKNADQNKAGQILRFCTGSSVICVNKIMVCFNYQTGLNRRPIGLSRRPIGHACGATLELSTTYSSYPEFRSEFDSILSSNEFV